MVDATIVTLVQDSWAPVKNIGSPAAELFYQHLFQQEPSVRTLFKNSDLKVQAGRLFKMLDTAVDKLTDLGTLVPVLKDLGRRHVEYNVGPQHYAPVGRALVATLAAALGPAFTPEVQAAWITVYGVVSDTMQAGASEDPDAYKLGYPVPAGSGKGGAGACPVPHGKAAEKKNDGIFGIETSTLLTGAVAGAAIALGAALAMGYGRTSRH